MGYVSLPEGSPGKSVGDRFGMVSSREPNSMAKRSEANRDLPIWGGQEVTVIESPGLSSSQGSRP